MVDAPFAVIKFPIKAKMLFKNIRSFLSSDYFLGNPFLLVYPLRAKTRGFSHEIQPALQFT